MTHDEFLAILEKCRDQRGALSVIRETARLLEKAPPEVAQVEKLIQDWSKPVALDRAVRLALQVLDREPLSSPNVAGARELLSGLLLATGSEPRSTREWRGDEEPARLGGGRA